MEKEAKPALAKHLNFLAAFLVIVVAEWFYRKPLYNFSEYFIVDILQQKLMTGWLTTFFHGLSILGEGAIYFVVFLFVYNYYSNGRAFYYILFLSMCLSVQNAMKIGYHEPRPYMTFDGITAIGCSHEYGQPSGHSLFSAGFAMFLFLDFLGGQSETRPKLYYGALVGAISFFSLMGLARMYQGVHSLDQVLYGWQLGLFMSIYFHFCLRDLVIDHVNTKLRSNTQKQRNALIATCLFIIVFAVQIAAFYLVDNLTEVPEDWKQRLVAKCGSQPLFRTFHYKSFIYIGITPAAYTAYLGLLLREHYFAGVPTHELFLKTDLFKFLLRIFVILLIGAPFGLLFVLVPWSITQIWVLLIFKTLIPCLSSMLVIFLFAPVLFEKFNLINQVKFVQSNALENPSLQEKDGNEPLLVKNDPNNQV